MEALPGSGGGVGVGRHPGDTEWGWGGRGGAARMLDCPTAHVLEAKLVQPRSAADFVYELDSVSLSMKWARD